jgi:hypothetical protein
MLAASSSRCDPMRTSIKASAKIRELAQIAGSFINRSLGTPVLTFCPYDFRRNAAKKKRPAVPVRRESGKCRVGRWHSCLRAKRSEVVRRICQGGSQTGTRPCPESEDNNASEVLYGGLTVIRSEALLPPNEPVVP